MSLKCPKEMVIRKNKSKVVFEWKNCADSDQDEKKEKGVIGVSDIGDVR